jgi:hypothetical protein
VVPIAFDTLNSEAAAGDDVPDVLEIVELRSTRMIT